MKIRSLVAITLTLLLFPAAVHARTGAASTQPPPIEQTLVREGDFALRLSTALRMGELTSEVEAEERLAAIGIAPRNGWIADYPMTPDIIIEVRDAVAAAASAGKLPMSTEEAVTVVQNVNAELGLSVYSEAYSAGYDQQAYGEYYDPGVVQDYYYGYAPSAVTYYPPPWDYSYLYSWVPYPFWWGGFGFSGFFILNDFHRVVVINRGGPRGHPRRHKMISNHYRDKGSGRFRRVDPLARAPGNQMRRAQNLSPPGGAKGGTRQGGAASILARGTDRYRANPGGRPAFNERANRSPASQTQLKARPKAGSSQGKNITRAGQQRYYGSYGYKSAVPDQRHRSSQRIVTPNRNSGNSSYRASRPRNFGRTNRATISRGGSGSNRTFSSPRSGSGGFSGGLRGASRGGSFGGRSGFSGGRSGAGGCRGRC